VEVPVKHARAAVTASLAFLGVFAGSASVRTQDVVNVPGPGALPRKPRDLRHLDTPIGRLVRDFTVRRSEAMRRAAADQLSIDRDRVLVTIDMLDEAGADSMVAALPGFGATVSARYRRWIDAQVPIIRLAELSRLPGVSLVHRPIGVHPLAEAPQVPFVSAASTGTHQTEGVARSNANAWHAAGLQGGGVSVAVIDSFQYYTEAQAVGELPSALGTTGTIDLSSDHGTAVAEIVYDMAPGAALTISSPSGSCTAMAGGISGLAQAGYDVISSSIGPLQCGAGDGNGANDPIAAAASDARARGSLFVQAAGNHSQRHWDGTFNGDADAVHLFAPGVNVNQLGQLPAGYPITLSLRWNAWPVTDQDYDLYLLETDGVAPWQVVASSEGFQTGSQPPTEAISVQAPVTGYYGFAIQRFSGSGSHVLSAINFSSDLQYKVNDRSLVGPATSAQVTAVAAVDVNSLALESYSSWGPTYGPGGSLAGGLAQPQIAGFANVDTWTFKTKEQGSVFNGTSAATPHVAGAAAVAWGANRCLTPAQVVDFLKGRSTDGGVAGYDFKYGAGVLNMGLSSSDLCDGARGDFNGDGKADILWRHRGGALYVWFMSGTSLTGSSFLPTIPLNWQIQGVGDFDGDGKADILWRELGSGATYLWLMNGAIIAVQGYTGAQTDSSWQIQGVGDFDGNGKADILWRHTGGALYLWFMSGTSVVSQSFVNPITNLWQVARLADFNGDGKADILWREVASGATYLWLMNAAVAIGASFTSAQTDNSWQIHGTGDFDGDGKADILWRHTGGALYVWFMSGASVVSSSFLGSIANNWQVQALADFNGDGKVDILWREGASGSTYEWLMNGAFAVGQGYTMAQTDTSWNARLIRRASR
jgi:hypothetical protein